MPENPASRWGPSGFHAIFWMPSRGKPPAPVPGRNFRGVSTVRACLKIERGPAARLLTLVPQRGIGSAYWLPKPLPFSCRELTCAARRQSARCGDAQASPPGPSPKSTAAGPLSILRQAVTSRPAKSIGRREVASRPLLDRVIFHFFRWQSRSQLTWGEAGAGCDVISFFRWAGGFPGRRGFGGDCEIE